MSKPDIEAFIEQANLHDPTIKFMAETFDTEDRGAAFSDTVDDGRRLPTNFDRTPTIRNKIHKNESKLRKQKLQGGKRFIAICDTIPALSVYYKGSLNNKNGILYKANHNFHKFLKNHQSFPYKKGKLLKDMLVRAPPKKRLTKGSRDVRSVTRCIFSHNRFVSILAIIPAGCVLYNKCGQLSR